MENRELILYKQLERLETARNEALEVLGGIDQELKEARKAVVNAIQNGEDPTPHKGKLAELAADKTAQEVFITELELQTSAVRESLQLQLGKDLQADIQILEADAMAALAKLAAFTQAQFTAACNYLAAERIYNIRRGQSAAMLEGLPDRGRLYPMGMNVNAIAERANIELGRDSSPVIAEFMRVAGVTPFMDRKAYKQRVLTLGKPND